jgi:hypothetical protein
MWQCTDSCNRYRVAVLLSGLILVFGYERIETERGENWSRIPYWVTSPADNAPQTMNIRVLFTIWENKIKPKVQYNTHIYIYMYIACIYRLVTSVTRHVERMSFLRSRLWVPTNVFRYCIARDPRRISFLYIIFQWYNIQFYSEPTELQYNKRYHCIVGGGVRSKSIYRNNIIVMTTLLGKLLRRRVSVRGHDFTVVVMESQTRCRIITSARTREFIIIIIIIIT